jgi:tRNA pseudouridine38-40 synthase
MKNRYKLQIAYDGTAYNGWQVQPNGTTIQAVLETAFATLSEAGVKVHGSGRTDRGVHARCQVAHVDLVRAWEPIALCRALNGILPPDIRVLRTSCVSCTFHARKSAVTKQYRYFIWNGEIQPPVRRLYTAHVRQPLDIGAMQKAAAHLVGRHDFAAFTANPRRDVASTVRRLYELRAARRGAEITIIATAEGFLYKMVRSLVGFLIRVGEGSQSPSHAREVLQSARRTARVPTAPPEGLFLWQVRY